MSAKDKLIAHENTLKIENALRHITNRDSQVHSDPTIYIDDNGNEFITTERIIKDVSPPTDEKPTDEKVFSNPGNLPDYKFLRDHFRREGKLTQTQVLRIIKMATSIFEKEPNMLQVPSPVTVCGDIHGQLYDLFKLFEICGDPDETSFLFLGDYVDRGSYSLEVVLLLYSMKINHPKTFTMLRGNHESKQMTQHFTFKSECLLKYSMNVYNASLKSFASLPISAIMNKQFFCVHGGLSKGIEYLSDINKINRFQVDFPSSGAYCDLMWSDPSPDYDTEVLDPNDTRANFRENYERGCSYMFSYNAVCKFLEKNNLLCVIRAHQAQDSGYRMYKKTEPQQFPSVITLFSAPNYCGTYGNKAAVLRYDSAVMNIRQFSAQTEPYHLPNFMNVFTWSIPFVAERVCEVLFSVLNICTDEELEMDTPLSRELAHSLVQIEHERKKKSLGIAKNTKLLQNKDTENKIGADATDDKNITEPKSLDRTALRNKILAIGRLSRMFNLLRQESEKVEQLRSLSGGLTLPKGVLLDGTDQLNKTLSNFEKVRLADLSNEGIPPTEEEENKKKDEEYIKLWEKIKNEA